MKILQLIDTLRSGGAERMAVNMAAIFSEADIDNMLIVSREIGMQGKRVNEKTQLKCLNKSGTLDWKAFSNLLKYAKEFCPEVVHVHSTSLFWGVLLKGLLKNVKLIWHDHYGLSDQLKPGDRKAERIAIKGVDGIVSVNDRLRSWAVEELEVSSKRVILIENFPYLKYVEKRESELGSPVILLQMANFRPQKNHLLAIDALHVLRSKYYIDVELWLAGSITLDQQYTKEVYRAIAAHGLEDQVKVLGEVEDVELILGKADIGLLSSRSEGLPVSLLEYGLAGLPVVTTDVGLCKQVLQAGKFGKIVESDDQEGFVQKIKELIDDYRGAIQMGESFHEHILNSYGAAQFLRKYRDFVAKL
ncbi:glycosyltransferase [Algoriphagus sp. AGSA1]|uniref:glycosyltransferase n=1 Tax=Algoriphagus sp. AGSA1 TaxID=2907213 RepID=UPI001F3A8083|nr:glycosyltransferase [Algoriphagus sp. AGSA1]MCE7055278.1 glycosyltransferase [Algoriphagus sp. AGSA1]